MMYRREYDMTQQIGSSCVHAERRLARPNAPAWRGGGPQAKQRSLLRSHFVRLTT